MGQGVGACAHGLRLQRLDGEAIAHFVRHHAQQIVLHGEGTHGGDRPVFVQGDRQIAGIEVTAFDKANAFTLRAFGGAAGELHACARLEAHALIEQVHLAAAHDGDHVAALREAHFHAAGQGSGIRAVQIQISPVGKAESAEPHPHCGGGGLRFGGWHMNRQH